MLASGLLDKWKNEFNGEEDLRRTTEEPKKEVLTVQDLRLGFLLFVMCLALSFVVFLAEIIGYAITYTYC